VAPILTAGFILSLYSSAGCNFIDLSVGFVPNNAAWNQSRAELGLFYYYDNSTVVSDNKYQQTFHEGCVRYTDDFDDAIVSKDRTWKVARVMASIALSGSLLATITIWIIILSPVPVQCVWPGILLPTSMLAFIAEGSKFLFFDIALCRNAVWFPSGVDSLPEEAASCGLGPSAFVGIAAGSLHLVALLAVCMESPRKRKLNPDYGRNYDLTADEEALEASLPKNDVRDSYRGYMEEDPSMLEEDIYTAGPQESIISEVDAPSSNHTTSEGDNSTVSTDQKSNHSGSLKKSSGSKEAPYSSLDNNDVSPPPRVSESRIAVMSKMQLQSQNSGSSDLIATLVQDLDSSLAKDFK